jgi:hypothetical protein
VDERKKYMCACVGNRRTLKEQVDCEFQMLRDPAEQLGFNHGTVPAIGDGQQSSRMFDQSLISANES